MGKMYREYNEIIKRVDNFKISTINSVVNNIKTIAAKPIHIGNHWFYYVSHNGKDVPAYCHFRDYNENNSKFLPIYDEDNTGEFGWSDFMECCRIFDLINDRLFGTSEVIWE